jgi:LacI family transcriptional regulator
MAALNESNMDIKDYSVQICDSHDHALRLIPELFGRHNNIDGIFAVNDLTAVGAMIAVKMINKKVPEDIAITGFTNSFISYIADPELTTIDQKGFEMGQHAARMLLKRIKSDENYGPVTTILNTELVIRKSSIRKR